MQIDNIKGPLHRANDYQKRLKKTIMQIHYKRNIHFTRLIKAEGRLREFNFRKLTGSDGEPVFTVDVSDDRGNRILFRMNKTGNEWTIENQKQPAWILENEQQFHSIIEEELGQAG